MCGAADAGVIVGAVAVGGATGGAMPGVGVVDTGWPWVTTRGADRPAVLATGRTGRTGGLGADGTDADTMGPSGWPTIGATPVDGLPGGGTGGGGEVRATGVGGVGGAGSGVDGTGAGDGVTGGDAGGPGVEVSVEGSGKGAGAGGAAAGGTAVTGAGAGAGGCAGGAIIEVATGTKTLREHRGWKVAGERQAAPFRQLFLEAKRPEPTVVGPRRNRTTRRLPRAPSQRPAPLWSRPDPPRCTKPCCQFPLVQRTVVVDIVELLVKVCADVRTLQ